MIMLFFFVLLYIVVVLMFLVILVDVWIFLVRWYINIVFVFFFVLCKSNKDGLLILRFIFLLRFLMLEMEMNVFVLF